MIRLAVCIINALFSHTNDLFNDLFMQGEGSTGTPEVISPP